MVEHHHNRADLHPAVEIDRILDIEGITADAVRHRFLDVPLSKEQIAEFIQIPPR